MPRVTATQVAEIVEVDPTIVPFDPFITTANSLIDEVCLDSGYSESYLTTIELWLAAHFYAIRDNRVAEEKAGPVAQSYQFKVGLNFNVTIYGQQALVLDYAGNLAKLQDQATTGDITIGAGVFWAGTSESE
jgi:hypothetical protein